MRIGFTLVGTLLTCLLASTPSAQAFCGFYVAKAGAQLFNKASRVVFVRHDDKTVITMVNDFEGDPSEFAVVVPVPTFIDRSQVHVTNTALIDRLDAFTSPRLVEYFDDDPCMRRYPRALASRAVEEVAGDPAGRRSSAEALGVSIEAEYTVGEYDIVILSAQQSNGLQTWLRENGYQTPAGAARVLESYIRQKVRFFVAKVNVDAQAELGYRVLRPLQVAFESPKFMLPIRLGTVNADGPQDLLAYMLTRNGRVEATNYRTVKLPTDLELPLFVKDDFGDFYKAMFARQVDKEGMRSIFLEYAWDMSWCDPCAADPLSTSELRELGVFWLADQGRRGAKTGAADAFVTRLHVRYDGEHFPEDLMFQETPDKTNFQGRYVLRHPYEGSTECSAEEYQRELRARHEQQARNLVTLTGWSLGEVRGRMALAGSPTAEPVAWWHRLWKGD